MKSIVKTSLAILWVLVFVSSLATAQDLQQQLAKLGQKAAVSYVTPILSGWGNDLNSAIYYSADLHDILGFDVGLKVAASTFTNDDKTYTLTLPSTITVHVADLGYPSIPGNPAVTFSAGTDYDATVKANTAVGPKDNTVIKLKGTKQVAIPGYGLISLPISQTLLTLPGGVVPSVAGISGVPLVMPQFDLGLPFGFEAMLRYCPTLSAGDVGKFNYMGFGLRYDIDQWIPLFPIDIAVHFMTQKLNFKSKADKDIFTAKATAYGAEISKKFLILTLYGGFQLESSTLSLNSFTGYDPASGLSIPIQGFDIKGTDKSRLTVGVRLLLLIVNVQAEYSIAKNPVIALGAGITFR